MKLKEKLARVMLEASKFSGSWDGKRPNLSEEGKETYLLIAQAAMNEIADWLEEQPLATEYNMLFEALAEQLRQ